MKTIKQKKRKISLTLLIGFIILSLFLLMQTIGGKYDNVLFAWLWCFLLYVPPFVLLIKVSETNVKVGINGLFELTILYTIIPILIIILQPLAQIKAELTPFETIKLSSFFLIPIQLIINFLIWNNLIKKSKPIINDYIMEKPNIFISYNHQDSDIALKIREALKKAKIEVTIDREAMKVGTDIKDFIESSVKETNVTVSLISNKSLKSAWVAMETINTFFLEKFTPNKKFIACYTDEDFFQPEFTLETIDEIDKQIKKNQELIPKYHEKMLDTRDLNNQNTRLLALRNNLDEIVRRLRESLCLDVKETEFDSSMKRLIDAIKY